MPLLVVRTRKVRLVRTVFFLGRGTRKSPLDPRTGAAKVTIAPATGFPLLSVTVTASGIGKRSPTVADWPATAPAVMVVGAAARFSRVYLPGCALRAVAVPVKLPAILLAMSGGAVATPL